MAYVFLVPDTAIIATVSLHNIQIESPGTDNNLHIQYDNASLSLLILSKHERRCI